MAAAEAWDSHLADEWQDWLYDLLGDEDGVELYACLDTDEVAWDRDTEYHFDNWFATGGG
jgi:hypothetical protein